MCDTLADHLFTPQNAAFLLIDYQPAQLAAVRSMDHAGGLTVVAVDRNEHALRELPDGVRREVADTTDPSVATPLIDRIAGEVGPPDVAPMIRTTMKDQERSARSLELGTARVEAFSDAVMAVIITILAFQLQAPRGATLGAVRDQLPGLLVYVLSFVFVGIYWNNHHHLLRAADRLSGAAMWANLFLLFWLSLIPVLTEWLRDEYRHALPAAAYGAVALGAGLAYAILVRALIRANGRESAVAKAIGSDLKGYASLVLDAAGVGLAFVSPWISYALYVAVSIIWFVPDRRFTRS